MTVSFIFISCLTFKVINGSLQFSQRTLRELCSALRLQTGSKREVSRLQTGSKQVNQKLTGSQQVTNRKPTSNRRCQVSSCGSGLEPASCYQKVAGLISLVCMSKCPWARYWTPNCSWCAGRHFLSRNIWRVFRLTSFNLLLRFLISSSYLSSFIEYWENMRDSQSENRCTHVSGMSWRLNRCWSAEWVLMNLN